MAPLAARGEDPAEEAVARRIGGIGARVEVKLLAQAIVGATAAEGQVPQASDRDRCPVRLLQGTEERSCGRVKDVDVPVSLHVADQDIVAERAELGRSLDDPPGILEWAGAGG